MLTTATDTGLQHIRLCLFGTWPFWAKGASVSTLLIGLAGCSCTSTDNIMPGDTKSDVSSQFDSEKGTEGVRGDAFQVELQLHDTKEFVSTDSGEVDVCTPHCLDRNCGDDGCGGNCGECDDGLACNGLETCLGGLCLPGKVIQCDDGNPCTLDQCTEPLGCEYSATTGSCSDGDVCTLDDHCQQGECTGAAMECNDDNPCTDDQCNPGESGDPVCQFSHNAAPCDDGDPYTASDICVEGECLGQPLLCSPGGYLQQDGLCQLCDDSGLAFIGEGVAIDDGNLCTTDSCDPIGGVSHIANSIPCDDGDPNTSNDMCSAGTCTCVPECENADCGADSCGGTCGACLPSETCLQKICLSAPYVQSIIRVDGGCEGGLLGFDLCPDGTLALLGHHPHFDGCPTVWVEDTPLTMGGELQLGLFVALVTPPGTMHWYKTTGGSVFFNNRWRPVMCDPKARITLSGFWFTEFIPEQYTGQLWYDDYYIAAEEESLLVAQLNTDGDTLFASLYASPPKIKKAGIEIAASGLVHVAGTLSGPLSGVTTEFDTAQSGDGYVFQLSTSGVVLWANLIKAQTLHAVAISGMTARADNSICIVAGHSGDEDFGGGPVVDNGEQAKLTVACYASEGTYLWERTFTAQSGEGTFPYAGPLVGTNDGGLVFFGGSSHGGIDFGGGELLTPDDKISTFVVKLDSEGEHVWSNVLHSHSKILPVLPGSIRILDAVANQQDEFYFVGDYSGAPSLVTGVLTDFNPVQVEAPYTASSPQSSEVSST